VIALLFLETPDPPRSPSFVKLAAMRAIRVPRGKVEEIHRLDREGSARL